jgi:hypothetical protein
MTRITDPRELARRRKMYEQNVRDAIKEHGWHDTAVFPTKDEESPYFNYTTGLKEMNHPDLIIVGMPSAVAHRVLWTCVRRIQDGYRFTPDTYSTEVLEDLRVAAVEVLDPLNDVAPMTVTNRLYGQVEGVQIVWPDAADKFPWDEGFDQTFSDQQPLLGIWRGP